jgi:hypothetical protein
MAHDVDVGKPPVPAGEPPGQGKPHQFGLTAAMALALAFSVLFIWYSRNTGHSFWVYWAPFMEIRN